MKTIEPLKRPLPGVLRLVVAFQRWMALNQKLRQVAALQGRGLFERALGSHLHE